MTNLILFETTESVIELLWDIALAFFIVRLAFIYFILTFLSGIAITYLPLAAPLLAPLLLLSSALTASFTVSQWEVPAVAGFRLAIGGVAGVFMAVVVGVGMWEAGLGASGEMGWGMMMGLLGGFVVMPGLLMGFERREGRGETWHGHEEKRIGDAV